MKLAFFFSALALAACAPPQSVALKCPVTTASTDHVDARHVYRLDFVLTATDGAAPQKTSFSLTLGEHDKGNVVLGKNVPLNPPATNGAPTVASARQDVGVKVVATIGTLLGDDVMLDVATEVSAFDPPTTIRKIVTAGKALASPGKSTVVTLLEEDNKRYELSVTPTKLR